MQVFMRMGYLKTYMRLGLEEHSATGLTSACVTHKSSCHSTLHAAGDVPSQSRRCARLRTTGPFSRAGWRALAPAAGSGETAFPFYQHTGTTEGGTRIGLHTLPVHRQLDATVKAVEVQALRQAVHGGRLLPARTGRQQAQQVAVALAPLGSQVGQCRARRLQFAQASRGVKTDMPQSVRRRTQQGCFAADAARPPAAVSVAADTWLPHRFLRRLGQLVFAPGRTLGAPARCTLATRGRHSLSAAVMRRLGLPLSIRPPTASGSQSCWQQSL